MERTVCCSRPEEFHEESQWLHAMPLTEWTEFLAFNLEMLELKTVQPYVEDFSCTSEE
jgi:hypothetical protein